MPCKDIQLSFQAYNDQSLQPPSHSDGITSTRFAKYKMYCMILRSVKIYFSFLPPKYQNTEVDQKYVCIEIKSSSQGNNVKIHRTDKKLFHPNGQKDIG